MRYTIEKRKALKHDKQSRYVMKYQAWLERQRVRDREVRYPNKNATANVWLRRDKCPHCKEELVIKVKDGHTYKACKKHGLLQIKKMVKKECVCEPTGTLHCEFHCNDPKCIHNYL